MRSLSKRSLVLTLALCAAAAACKKEGDGAAGGGGAGAAGDDLNVVPQNADIVLGIDFAKVRASAIFKEYGSKLVEEATKDVAEFKSKCGFDPFESTKTASVGIRSPDSDKASGSIVIHSSVPREKIMECLEKVKPDAEAKGTKIVIDGKIAYITPKDGKSHVAVTHFGSDAVVALINHSPWTKDTVSQALAGNGSVKGSKDFMSAYGAIKKGQTLWFYANAEAEAAAQLKSAFDAKALYGSIDVTDGLAASFFARMKSSEEAAKVAKQIEEQAAQPQVQMFIPDVKVKSSGSEVEIAATMTAKQLKTVMSLVGGMIGGGLGGGGGGMPMPEAPAQ